MKRCPFCDEEIQDAAILCRFCNRDLAATDEPATQAQTGGTVAPRPTSPGRALLVIGVCGVALLVVVGALIGRASLSTRRSSAPTQVLNVSAGRSIGGFALTNRESVPLSRCDVTVLDQGDDEWKGTIAEELDPYETRRIGWDSFTMRGQSMPSYVGLGRKYFTVSCLVGATGDRRSAGVAF